MSKLQEKTSIKRITESYKLFNLEFIILCQKSVVKRTISWELFF